jgi:hypothetical protein
MFGRMPVLVPQKKDRIPHYQFKKYTQNNTGTGTPICRTLKVVYHCSRLHTEYRNT